MKLLVAAICLLVLTCHVVQAQDSDIGINTAAIDRAEDALTAKKYPQLDKFQRNEVKKQSLHSLSVEYEKLRSEYQKLQKRTNGTFQIQALNAKQNFTVDQYIELKRAALQSRKSAKNVFQEFLKDPQLSLPAAISRAQ